MAVTVKQFKYRRLSNLTIVSMALLASAFLLPGIWQPGKAAYAASGGTGPQVPQAATWQLQNPIPTRWNLNAVDMFWASEGGAVGEQSTLLHPTDGGKTWAAQNVPATISTIYSVRFFDALHGIAGSNNTILYTTNGGL